MSTWGLPYGCYGSRSMYGDRRIVDLRLCESHCRMDSIQPLLEDLIDKINNNPAESNKQNIFTVLTSSKRA